jgi:integrase
MTDKKTTWAALAKSYLDHRRSLGFAMRISGSVLMEFARFADHRGHGGPLTTELILHWASGNRAHSRRHQASRLSIVRGFARYMAARDGQSHVPEQRLLGSEHRRQQPHIYTDRQLRQLLRAAGDLAAVHPLRPKTYTTLFGLLASTGLRVSEALALQRADVDLQGGVLHIRQTKFRKSRLVPLHSTVTKVLRRYAAARDRHTSGAAGTAFFVGRCGRALPYSTVRSVFRQLCSKFGWRSNGTLPRPRIHDLRHTFACRRLLQWSRDGVPIDHAIASLSTYLGHAKVSDTYWYLSGTAELLAIAGRRFEQSVPSDRRHP